jgi:hypothetical protein
MAHGVLWLSLSVTLLAPNVRAAIPAWTPPANKSDWASRTIYQVLVDRFDRGDGDNQVRLT